MYIVCKILCRKLRIMLYCYDWGVLKKSGPPDSSYMIYITLTHSASKLCNPREEQPANSELSRQAIQVANRIIFPVAVSGRLPPQTPHAYFTPFATINSNLSDMPAGFGGKHFCIADCSVLQKSALTPLYSHTGASLKTNATAPQ